MDLQPGSAILVPLIVGVVEVLKRTGMASRWAPLASLVLGVAAGIFYLHPHEPARGLLAGVILALSAMGLWSGPKAMIRSFRAAGR